jgi:hypothetical protein
VPILVDAQMPPQLRELLEVFVGAAHPVHVLQPGESVRVDELWTCSKIAYWPGGERMPAPPSNRSELSDTPALARLLARVAVPRLAAFEVPGYPSKLYLTRNAAQGRPLANRDEVEALFRARGFHVADFGRLPMREQLRHLRAARTVVMEAGSSMYGLLFCRPGTRLGELTNEAPTEHEWCAGMFRALGMPLLLFPCETAAQLGGLRGAIMKRADPAGLEAFLDALEAMPVPGEGTGDAVEAPQGQGARA